MGAFIIYISTDYVFDGLNPPYSEDSVPNPVNKYGATKLLGEKAVLGINPGEHITFFFFVDTVYRFLWQLVSTK